MNVHRIPEQEIIYSNCDAPQTHLEEITDKDIRNRGDYPNEKGSKD